nr:RDD family protein [Mycolicibacterium komanii]CRL76892.1 proline-rich antigen, Pra [Mycolicibacterium komanii]
MTDQPQPSGDHPPPPGGYPPPPQGDGAPPTATGYPPPAQPVQALPKEAYTSWFTRVLAWLVDSIPIFILWGIGYALLLGTQETACITDVSEYELGEFCATEPSTVGQLAVTITSILVLAYVIWNYGYRQGTTGSSIGKSLLKFKVVGEKTGQPIGFGMSVVRQLAHIIDAAICYIGYLFPLWDAKRQTIADKLISTVCLPL